MLFLKQSTASQEIPLGPFVDSTDGNTEETGLTIANTDIKIWKAGATTLANKNSGGGTHISNGIYYAVLDATDTDTLGSLMIFVHVSGALPVFIQAIVLAANVYDSLVAGSDNLQVDTVQLSGTTQTARDIGASVLLSSGTGAGQISLSSGAVTAGTVSDKTGYALSVTPPTAVQVRQEIDSNSTQLAAIVADTNELQAEWVNGGRLDLIIDAILEDTGTTLPATLATIAGYIDTEVASILAAVDTEIASIITTLGSAGAGLTGIPWNASWDAEVQSECTDALNAYDPPTQAEIPTAGAIADAVWDEARAGHGTAGSFGEGVTSVQGNVTGSVASVAAGGITSGSFAAGAINDAAFNADVYTAGNKLVLAAYAALNTAFTDASTLNANGLLDRLRTLGWITRNKIEVTDANGNTVIYKDDNSTQAFSVNGMLTDSSGTTTRLRAA